MEKKSSGAGSKLLSALTQEQIESLLNAVGPETLLEKVEKHGKKTDTDIGILHRRGIRNRAC
jgi:hypothetical protein